MDNSTVIFLYSDRWLVALTPITGRRFWRWGMCRMHVGMVRGYIRKIPPFLAHAEETIVSSLLAAMTLVAFSQVVARYVFNSGWVAALELTRLLFAWLILFGMSYGVRIGAHIGVDAAVSLLPPSPRRIVGIVAALFCVLYAAILLDVSWLRDWFDLSTKGGALDYVSRMYHLELKTEDLHAPRWLTYLILPVGLLLFAVRCLEAAIQIGLGRRHSICGHEERELLDDQSLVGVPPGGSKQS